MEWQPIETAPKAQLIVLAVYVPVRVMGVGVGLVIRADQ